MAEDAFERYDFGDLIEVVDVGSWRYDEAGGRVCEMSRILHIRYLDLPEAAATEAVFRVRFTACGAIREAFALTQSTGFLVGHPG